MSNRSLALSPRHPLSLSHTHSLSRSFPLMSMYSCINSFSSTTITSSFSSSCAEKVQARYDNTLHMQKQLLLMHSTTFHLSHAHVLKRSFHLALQEPEEARESLKEAELILQPLEATTCQVDPTAKGHDARCPPALPLLSHVRFLLADLEQTASRHERMSKVGEQEWLVEGTAEGRKEGGEGGRRRTRGQNGLYPHGEETRGARSRGGGAEEVERVQKEVEGTCGKALLLLRSRDAPGGPQVPKKGREREG
jgi:hypothetical protein